MVNCHILFIAYPCIYLILDPRATTLRHITIGHNLSKATQDEPPKEWWQMREICDPDEYNFRKYFSSLPYSDNCESLVMYTFNDKIFPSQLNFITAGG